MTTDRISAIIAEPSAIISRGLAAALRRCSSASVQPVEVATEADLASALRTPGQKLIFVNPTLGGAFDPAQLRTAAPDDLRIIAIETVPVPRQVAAAYDATLTVSADIAAISALLTQLTAQRRDDTDERDALSQREKEIVALVVRGMTNKEIADKLYISVHTVITHRRNIARKLQIHSATGLTIYAIMNQLVDLSEINV